MPRVPRCNGKSPDLNPARYSTDLSDIIRYQSLIFCAERPIT